ncbi:outer membrane lipoprotein carrier protein LolA [Halovenus rubra]
MTPLSEDVTEDDLLSEFEDLEPPTEMNATVVVNATIQGESTNISYDMWHRLNGQSRTESSLTGNRRIEIDDGQKRWSYNPSEDTVEVRESVESPSRIEASINATKEILRLGNITDISETEYEGRDVYHVTFGGSKEDNERENTYLPPTVPSVGGGLAGGEENKNTNKTVSDSLLSSNATRVELWIDSEYMIILRQNRIGNQSYKMAYTDIAFNAGLDDTLFSFEPSEKTEVEKRETPNFNRYDSLEAAREKTSFSIETPDIDSTRLNSAFVVTRNNSNREEVRLQYETGNEYEITVAKRTPAEEPEDGNEDVAIGGVTGGYAEMGNGLHRIWWTVGDFKYSIITSTEIDRKRLIELAESMETT